jgi:hypothetical protein
MNDDQRRWLKQINIRNIDGKRHAGISWPPRSQESLKLKALSLGQLGFTVGQAAKWNAVSDMLDNLKKDLSFYATGPPAQASGLATLIRWDRYRP